MSDIINQTETGLNLFTSNKAFTFENGQTICPLTLAYETYGTLSPDKDNVVLVNHALSSNSHVNSHSLDPSPGWWEGIIGDKKLLDTSRFFIVCINNLGSCFGSSGPTTINPETKQPYRQSFPEFTFNDVVDSQKRLFDHLGIKKLYAVIAFSMGGMIALTWAQRYPDMVQRLVSASSCYKAYPTNIANRALQRDTIKLDPNWDQGNYKTSVFPGFKIARDIAMLTYRNPSELNKRFDNKAGPDSLANYLNYNANKFIAKFDANAYLYTLDAMDNFNISKDGGTILNALEKIQAKSLIISVDSDILYPPFQQKELHQHLLTAGVNSQFVLHNSFLGHDAFVIEKELMARYIQSFLV